MHQPWLELGQLCSDALTQWRVSILGLQKHILVHCFYLMSSCKSCVTVLLSCRR